MTGPKFLIQERLIERTNVPAQITRGSVSMRLGVETSKHLLNPPADLALKARSDFPWVPLSNGNTKFEPSNGNTSLTESGRCDPQPLRSDLEISWSLWGLRSKQTRAWPMTQSRSLAMVRRTLRLSRSNSQRKASNEKRNAYQCSST